MKAVTVESLGQIVVKDDVAKPSLEDGEVLLKVNAVALNPTDWKHAHYISEPGSLLGCDVMGTVVEAKGDGPLKVGQKVASLVHGGRRPDRGSFAEYARVDSKIAWPVPENVSDEQAAAMAGVGPHTAMQHLFLRHGLPWPGTGSAKDEPFLVWSGATSVGMYTIQLAKLIGCRVITTASEKNWDLLKQLGADDCFTYTDPETPNKIRAQYPNLAHALDCIVTGDSTKSCSQALGEKGGYITTLLPPKPEDNAGRDNVKIESALGYTLMGKALQIRGNQIPAIPSDYEGAQRWAKTIPELVKSGKLKSNPLLSQSGGLDKVPEGLELLRQNKVAAQKVVYRVD